MWCVVLHMADEQTNMLEKQILLLSFMFAASVKVKLAFHRDNHFHFEFFELFSKMFSCMYV